MNTSVTNKMPNVRIYVAMHYRENTVKQLTDRIYEPIMCGAANKGYLYDGKEDRGYYPVLRDDLGSPNISVLNDYYSELTGLYWAYQNDLSFSNDIIGLCHYRRYFAEPEAYSRGEQKLLTAEDAIRLLKDADFLVNGCGTDFKDSPPQVSSVYEQYAENHDIKIMDEALERIELCYPLKFYEDFEYEIKQSGAMCVCNMFITTKDKFDEYCRFLFNVLIGIWNKYRTDLRNRELGYLSERLLRPWLIASGYSGRQIPQVDWEKYSGYIWR